MSKPRKKVRVLHDLVIDEVSSVSRGAGEGCLVALAKAHRDETAAKFAAIFSKPRRTFGGYDPRGLKKYGKPSRDDDAPRFSSHDDDTDELSRRGNVTDDDDNTGGTPQGAATRHIHELANLLLESAPSLSRQDVLHWLLHNRKGRALALAFFNKREDHDMNYLGNDMVLVAKGAIENGNTNFTREDFYKAIDLRAQLDRRAGETREQAFARCATATDEGQLLMKAMRFASDSIYPSTARAVSDTSGSSSHTPNDAYAELLQKADTLRRRDSSLSQAQAFAKVYADSANVEIVKRERAENRPRA